jgi:signal transduction histidine kinase
MELTKELQSDIEEVYEALWDGLFNADIEKYTSALDDNYRLIGTTGSEFFYSREEAVDFLKLTGEQLVGNIERRKSQVKIEKIENLILILEKFDAYVKTDNEWIFYSNVRVSTWMQQLSSGWKIVQQHFSVPDSKADEGQTIGLEKITKENIELRDAIKRRTIELENKNQELEVALAQLKATQTQLIHSEKMASLGELTAGIAHEIQNPLNFVNNFSEVNIELMEELDETVREAIGNRQQAIGNSPLVAELLTDIKQNLEKNNHHGKRADAIVKGMLQHSRTSGLIKEPADINKLADEYLRLAYQGLRAKDNSFNATLQREFDGSISDVNIIPQDIGRVILNIINNAFHAVDEKKKSGIEKFEPTVLVSTKKEAGNIIISIKDNGNGIPQKVIDKIFQPFFTTKPTGLGTGLGLSLSYDIIKAHGGEIKVKTVVGEGSEFIVALPADL